MKEENSNVIFKKKRIFLLESHSCFDWNSTREDDLGKKNIIFLKRKYKSSNVISLFSNCQSFSVFSIFFFWTANSRINFKGATCAQQIRSTSANVGRPTGTTRVDNRDDTYLHTFVCIRYNDSKTSSALATCARALCNRARSA